MDRALRFYFNEVKEFSLTGLTRPFGFAGSKTSYLPHLDIVNLTCEHRDTEGTTGGLDSRVKVEEVTGSTGSPLIN